MNVIGKQIVLAGEQGEILTRKGAILTAAAPQEHMSKVTTPIPTPKGASYALPAQLEGKKTGKGKGKEGGDLQGKRRMETAPPPGRKMGKPLDPKRDQRFGDLKEVLLTPKEGEMKKGMEENVKKEGGMSKSSKKQAVTKKKVADVKKAKARPEGDQIRLTAGRVTKIIDQVMKGEKRSEKKEEETPTTTQSRRWMVTWRLSV